jgi:hypothetical protein
MITSPTGIVVAPLSRMRVRTDTKSWYRQFWPWFLIALPATSVVFSFATLYIAVSGADEVVPHEGDSASYSAPSAPSHDAAAALPADESASRSESAEPGDHADGAAAKPDHGAP